MIAASEGAANGPGWVTTTCHLCGWWHLAFGLRGPIRWERARAACNDHLTDNHPRWWNPYL